LQAVAWIAKKGVFWNMTRYLLTALILDFCLTGASAQEPIRYFELSPPKHKIGGCLYRHIEFMDSRPDTVLIGPIQIGSLNNIEARLLFKTPILPQLQRLIDSMADSAAKDGTLLFQLRDISFVEPLKTRYLFVKATLYVRTDSGYRKLSTFENTDVLDGYDVSTQVNSIVNGQLDDFIAAALTRPATDPTIYTLRDIAHIDSIEVHSLPLYTVRTFTDGIYLNYASFSKQLPDRQGMIKVKRDGSVTSVHVLDSASNKIKLSSKSLYAVVYKGKPYIATEYGYYPLERVRDNFFFTGDIHIRGSKSEAAELAIIIGVGAALNVLSGFEETYDVLIDPLTGNFVHLRRIDKPETP
jgi:hypothetical protein